MAMAASCAIVSVLLDVGPSFNEGHNVLDFGLQERVKWREEATGVGVTKRSTTTIHAAEGGTGTRAGTGAGNGAAETFVCTGTATGARVCNNPDLVESKSLCLLCYPWIIASTHSNKNEYQ